MRLLRVSLGVIRSVLRYFKKKLGGGRGTGISEPLFEYWDLEFLWDLDFGAWNFSNPSRQTREIVDHREKRSYVVMKFTGCFHA